MMSIQFTQRYAKTFSNYEDNKQTLKLIKTKKYNIIYIFI